MVKSNHSSDHDLYILGTTSINLDSLYIVELGKISKHRFLIYFKGNKQHIS